MKEMINEFITNIKYIWVLYLHIHRSVGTWVEFIRKRDLLNFKIYLKSVSIIVNQLSLHREMCW